MKTKICSGGKWKYILLYWRKAATHVFISKKKNKTGNIGYTYIDIGTIIYFFLNY